MSISTKAARAPMVKINLVFDEEVYKKIMYWIDKAPGEVSGLGKITIDPDGTFKVISAFLLDQENTGTTTDIESNAVAKMMYETRNDPGHLNFWWHSHVNMDCFWSGTDIETIKEFGAGGFVLASVLNKKHQCRTAYYVRGEMLPEVFIDDIPTTIANAQKYVNPQWDEEYTAKVKQKTYPSYGYYGRNYGGHDDYWNTQDHQKKNPNDDDAGKEEGKTETESDGQTEGQWRDSEYWYQLELDAPSMDAEEYNSLTDEEKEYVDYFKSQNEQRKIKAALTSIDTEAQDDIKVAIIERDVTTLALAIPQAADQKNAMNILYAICGHINRAKLVNEVRAATLRKRYIDIYNHHHGIASGKVIEIKPKTPKELEEPKVV